MDIHIFEAEFSSVLRSNFENLRRYLNTGKLKHPASFHGLSDLIYFLRVIDEGSYLKDVKDKRLTPLIKALTRRLPQYKSVKSVISVYRKILEKLKVWKDDYRLVSKVLAAKTRKEVEIELKALEQKGLITGNVKDFEKLKRDLEKQLKDRAAEILGLFDEYLNVVSSAFIVRNQKGILVYAFGTFFFLSEKDYKGELSPYYRIHLNFKDREILEDAREVGYNILLEDVLITLRYLMIVYSLVDGASDLVEAIGNHASGFIETLDPLTVDYIVTLIASALTRVSVGVESISPDKIRDLWSDVSGGERHNIGPRIMNTLTALEGIKAHDILGLLNSIDSLRQNLSLMIKSFYSSLLAISDVHAEIREAVREAKEEYSEAKPLVILSALSAIILAADGILDLYGNVRGILRRLGIFLAGARIAYAIMRLLYDIKIVVEFRPIPMLGGESLILRGNKNLGRIRMEASRDRKKTALFALVSLLLLYAFLYLRLPQGFKIAILATLGVTTFITLAFPLVRYERRQLYPRGEIKIQWKNVIRVFLSRI